MVNNGIVSLIYVNEAKISMRAAVSSAAVVAILYDETWREKNRENEPKIK